MSNLTDKQSAEKYRQIADLMDETGNTITAAAWRELADHLDPPPGPFAGLNRVRWVEIEDGYGTRRVTHVRGARESHPDWSLVRVVPDGDARDVLVIPVEEARSAVAYRQTAGHWVEAGLLLADAVERHEARWSS